MKVQSPSTQGLPNVDKSKTDKVSLSKSKEKSASAAKGEMSSSARVDLSERAQDMKRIKEIAMNTPDVNEAKVAKYQKLIDDGKYKINAEGIADKMVDEYLIAGE